MSRLPLVARHDTNRILLGHPHFQTLTHWPAGVLGEDPAALIVAVGVVRQAHGRILLSPGFGPLVHIPAPPAAGRCKALKINHPQLRIIPSDFRSSTVQNPHHFRMQQHRDANMPLICGSCKH